MTAEWPVGAPVPDDPAPGHWIVPAFIASVLDDLEDRAMAAEPSPRELPLDSPSRRSAEP